MTTLVIDRSTENQTISLMDEKGEKVSCELDGSICRSGSWVSQAKEFVDGRKIDRIIVGMGPGSFAGIRAALAFAQGYAIGNSASVYGLPSPCGCKAEGSYAIVGDARRELFWIALFKDSKLSKEVFQVRRDELLNYIPEDYCVFSPDAKRIDEPLKEIFKSRYKGFIKPTSETLADYAVKNEDALINEPLPLYLNPAVRAQ